MPDIDLEALSTAEHGYTVDDEDDDDPILLDQDGNYVDTWRERYPYDQRMPRDEYDPLKRSLQIELLKLQNHIRRRGDRHVIVFEVVTPPARAAQSSDSWSTSTPAPHGSWP